MKFFEALVLSCLAAVALAAPSDISNIESNEVEPSGSWERLARMLSSCASGKDDMASCLAVKGVTAINRAARAQEVQLFNGVHFERDASVSVRDAKSLDETSIASTLPAEPLERAARLFSLAMESATNFLQSHSLQVKLAPEEIATAARTFNEARGKIKKLLGPILLGVGVKLLAIVTIFGGGLVLLVTKALIVAKLAFVLASILGLSKLFGGEKGGASSLFNKGGNGGSQNAGWSNSGSGGSNAGWSSGAGSGSGWSSNGGGSASAAYPYARSYETQDAQDLAYAAQKQQ